ncbi:MAG: tRNA-splicing ligase RtcB [Parcubacteria group bacterium Gr01-1014_29]|nr:MAG: tRNA-splicing ligase RtcB [Parcubacteria group bacterium Gr01-1014_29]
MGCDLTDQKLIQILEQITSLPGLARPVVCLPDIHMKEKTEAPASFVAATDNVVIPELTAPSVGCGMGVIATTLTRADITSERLEMFYAQMQRHRGPNYGTWDNILLWLGIKKRPHNKYDFSEQELVEAVRDGARAAVKKYNLPSETLDHVEYRGDAMKNETKQAIRISSILPRAAFASGRHDIGYGFKGNHFLEIQYVETVADQQTAHAWGLYPETVVVMYHGGGGAVSHYLGRYFARRKKDSVSLRSRLFQFLGKLVFHFGSFEGLWHIGKRWRYYFVPKQFQEVLAHSFEGKRLLASIAASLNYSYAFRLAIVKRVQDALEAAFGPTVKTHLVWDNIHNSIRPETIGGKEYIVHRHTATRVFDGRPVLISGFNNTNSYIGIGLAGAQEHLFSADHGAGETIKTHAENGNAKPHPENFTTNIYTSKPPYKKTAIHITNEGLDAVIKPLEETGAMRPVVYTRPIAVFKG